MSAGQFVLLWSQRQNALRIDTLAMHASCNRLAYTMDAPGDERLLMVGTRAEAEATAASIRPTMAQREHQRAAA